MASFSTITTPNEDKHKKRKFSATLKSSASESSDEGQSGAGGNTSAGFASFLVIEPVDKSTPIKHSIFAIQKVATCAIGQVKSAKKLRSGSILLEVVSRAQYESAMALTKWVDVDVQVTEHRGLNSSRGVIRCREFRDCSNEEILEALQSQGVTAVRQINARRNGKLEPTNTFILTFNKPAPPKHITAAYMRITVDMYIPNPLRCYQCQRYGHSKASCSHPAACARCGKQDHTDDNCHEPEQCVNCKGTHTAYSKQCPEWQRQRDITHLKFEKNISFAEAQRMLKPTTPAAGTKSFASVVKSKQSVSTQTYMTWPNGASEPDMLLSVAPINTATSSQTEETSDVQAALTATAEVTTAAAPHAVSTASKQNDTSKDKNTSKDNLDTVASTSSNPALPRRTPTSPKRVGDGAKAGSKQQTKPNNSSKGGSSSKPSKGSDDPIKTYNRFGGIDEMEVDRGPPKA